MSSDHKLPGGMDPSGKRGETMTKPKAETSRKRKSLDELEAEALAKLEEIKARRAKAEANKQDLKYKAAEEFIARLSKLKVPEIFADEMTNFIGRLTNMLAAARESGHVQPEAE